MGSACTACFGSNIKEKSCKITNEFDNDGKDELDAPNDSMYDDEQKGFDDLNEFANNLFLSIIQSNQDKTNLILSPLSISVAMTICMCGAQKNTLNEMINVLYPNIKNKELTFENAKSITMRAMNICTYYNMTHNGNDDEPVIKIANKLWIDKEYKFLPSYIKATGVDSVDSIDTSNVYKAANIVNKWCSKKTLSNIKNIVNSDNMHGARCLIVNAIYFKGKFVKKFVASKTKNDVPFFSDYKCDEEICKVSMMHNSKRHYFVQKLNNIYDIVKLQYKASDLCLILVINNQSDNKNRTSITINDILSIRDWMYNKLNLYVPKFEYQFETELNDNLIEMGISSAFDKSADFSAMTGSNNLWIDKVIHKAIVEVNEEGSMASACTVDIGQGKGVHPQSSDVIIPTIRFNHPFDFFICDEKMKTILFAGRYIGQ